MTTTVRNQTVLFHEHLGQAADLETEGEYYEILYYGTEAGLVRRLLNDSVEDESPLISSYHIDTIISKIWNTGGDHGDSIILQNFHRRSGEGRIFTG